MESVKSFCQSDKNPNQLKSDRGSGSKFVQAKYLISECYGISMHELFALAMVRNLHL